MLKNLTKKVSYMIEDPDTAFSFLLGGVALLLIILILAFVPSAKATEPDNFIAVSHPRSSNGGQIQFVLTTLQFPDKCKNGMVAIGTTRRGETEPDTLSLGCWASSNEGVLLWDFNKSPADGTTIPKSLFQPIRRRAETGV